MSKGFAGIYILVGIIIVAVLGGAYYFGIGKNIIPLPFKKAPVACIQDVKQCPDGSYVGREGPNCEFKSCPASKSSSSSDETTNWKTYRNEKFKFELKYPDGWNLKDDSNEVVISTEKHSMAQRECKSYQQKKIERDESFGPGPCRFGIYISVRNKLVRKDNDIWNIKAYPLPKFPDAFRIDGEYLGPSLSVGIPLPYDDKKFANLEGYTSLTNDLHIFDRILSTFKFLDQEGNNIEGKFCGGIAANLPKNQCPTGYKCQLDGDYPDVGGKCVKSR